MATPPNVQARRAHLTQRLVSQQITMEEATELFSIMMRETEQLRAAVTAASRKPVAPPKGGKPPPPPPGWKASPSLENLDELLLYGGPLLGVLAALLKKSGLDTLTAVARSSAETPAPSSPPPSGATSRTSRSSSGKG